MPREYWAFFHSLVWRTAELVCVDICVQNGALITIPTIHQSALWVLSIKGMLADWIIRYGRNPQNSEVQYSLHTSAKVYTPPGQALLHKYVHDVIWIKK